MKQLTRPLPRAAHQSGVSVIELLVGLTIGLIVSVAALSSFSSTRFTSATLGDSTRLHQDAATAFRTIGHHLRQAGAQQLIDTGGGNVEFNGEFEGYGGTLSPQALQGLDGANNGPDRLEVSHDTDATLNPVDCLGQGVHPRRGITNRFELVGDSLRCQGSGGNVPAPLIAGVEDFQVRYGVRTNDTLQYLNADASWTTANWNAVETVMVCLRLVGQVGGHTGQAIAGCRDNEVVANDGRIRRVFVRVFSMRNIAL
jgi:type IV pilus assembly protein PilW